MHENAGARTTAALKDRKWADAILAMQGVRAHNQPQKQGTLQRWVRDCGFAEDEMLRMRLLDMVVRCGKPDGEASGGNAHDPAAALAAAAAGVGVAQSGAVGRSVFPNEMSLPMGVEMGGGGLVDGSSEMRVILPIHARHSCIDDTRLNTLLTALDLLAFGTCMFARNRTAEHTRACEILYYVKFGFSTQEFLGCTFKQLPP